MSGRAIMNSINTQSANTSKSNFRTTSVANNHNKEQATKAQKDTPAKPSQKKTSDSYMSNKSRIEANPMKENVKIAFDVVA